MSITATSYGINHDPAYAGMVADGQTNDIISKVNSTDATIPYGKAVFRVGEQAAKPAVPASVFADFVGFVIREVNRAYMPDQAFGAVPLKDMSVLTMGSIWVVAAEAITAGDPIFVRVGATGTGDVAKAAGAGDTLAISIPQAKAVTSAAAGKLVKITLVVGG